ncbi:MAG: hypothetical protein AVDCRST_MAG68-565 [uncultured Gemmatimonadetes bacterium]|uniref:Uncharacterized protein n=1 Tax=uncultured Gemmatimonadota bacterium TaxID=203437 RepID=A0A6J4KAW0_9BACT|nr:MAG: hypothetical protein AVDCRST_MAG68-565 [uncultured Gemmatimonadota bacterium]
MGRALAEPRELVESNSNAELTIDIDEGVGERAQPVAVAVVSSGTSSFRPSSYKCDWVPYHPSYLPFSLRQRI